MKQVNENGDHVLKSLLITVFTKHHLNLKTAFIQFILVEDVVLNMTRVEMASDVNYDVSGNAHRKKKTSSFFHFIFLCCRLHVSLSEWKNFIKK